MSEDQFFNELESLLSNKISLEDKNKVISYYKDKLDKQETKEKREKVFNSFKSPQAIVKPIIAVHNFASRSTTKARHSITIGFATLFSNFKENKSFLKKLVNTIFVILIMLIVIVFVTLSISCVYFGIKLFLSYSLFDLPIRLMLASISFSFFALAVLSLQLSISSLRHIPYLALALLRRMK